MPEILTLFSLNISTTKRYYNQCEQLFKVEKRHFFAEKRQKKRPTIFFQKAPQFWPKAPQLES